MTALRYVFDETVPCPPGWSRESYGNALREALSPLGIWLVISNGRTSGPTGLQGPCDDDMRAQVASALDRLRAQRSTSAVVVVWRR